MSLLPFSPLLSDTTKLTATNVTGSAALTLPTTEGGFASGAPGARHVRICNAGSVIVFIQLGDSTVAATTAKMPILPGGTEILTLGGATYVAAITASGSADVYFTPGMGV